MLKKAIILVSLIVAPAILHGQARPAATRAGELQVGGGYSIVTPDFGTNHLGGIMAYADYDFRPNIGIEAEVRFANMNARNDVTEKTYLIGPRYIFHYRKLAPYAKLLVGRGVFNFPANTANLAYNMIGIGGGLDYHVKHHIDIRVIDVERQDWFSFQKSSLTPTAISFGVAYHF